MTEAENPSVGAIATAIRLARELSEAIAKAEELGAKVDVEVQTLSIAGKKVTQVMVCPVKF